MSASGKPEQRSSSLHWPYPREVAHRGGGTLAPENTLAGLRCGLAHGFRGVEFDAMLAQDGVPVLMHDPLFGRTIRAAGGVRDYPARALMALDAGSWLGEQFRGEPVCTLLQAMQFCAGHGIWMNIEIKPADPDVAAETGRAVAAAAWAFFKDSYAAGADMAGLPLFSSFSFDALRAAQEEAPAIARGWLTDKIEDGWLAQLQALEAVALHTNQRHLNAAQAAAVKQAGYGLFCYTVNEPARAREIRQWGVDGFCTDRLDLFPQTHV
ncbi:glycerophosphodiester phosphodiesterase [Oxalobacteraceae bacterium CAVE-383]|nr:glycerophosphodiester phosphodiesterase [Oxalobacteraceae bacterium CAVE-383]